MSIDKTNDAIKKIKASAIVQQVFGWIITIFCIMVVLGASISGIKNTIDFVMIILFTFFIVLGVLLIYKGHKKGKLIKTYYQYYSLIESDPQKSIDFLASNLGLTTETAKKNISEMIVLGLFPNIFIDTMNNCLRYKTPEEIKTILEPANSNQAKYATVVCKGCGATNKIISGTVTACEYCGLQISDN